MDKLHSHRQLFQDLGPKEWQNLGLAASLEFYIIWIGMEIARHNFFPWVLSGDYVAFWSAGYIANRYGITSIYDLNLMAEIQAWAVAPTDSAVVNPMKFLYFPVFVLPFQILATIPIKWSFLVWMLLNLGGFLIYLRFSIRSIAPDFQPGRLQAMLFISYPVFLNLVNGQVGFLLAVCIGEFLRQMRAGRPFRAGLWLGGLLLKPQALMLIIPALAIQRMWGALLGVATTAFLIVTASAGLAGVEGIRQLFNLWIDVGNSLRGNQEFMTNWRMVGTHLAHWMPAMLAWAFALTGLGATLGVGLLLWRRSLKPDHPAFTTAVLGTLAATAAISWHTYHHMLVMLIPPIAYLYVEGTLSERMLSLWIFVFPPAVLAALGIAWLTEQGLLYPGASGFPLGMAGLLVNLGFLVWAFRRIHTVPMGRSQGQTGHRSSPNPVVAPEPSGETPEV